MTNRTAHLALATLLTLGGCAADDPLQMGSVEVALTAPGSDGVTYRLPQGTTLDLFVPGFFDSLPLDGDETVLSFSLPPNTYSARLMLDGNEVNDWPIERINADATVDVVLGTLLTPMPLEIVVTENAVTGVVLSFAVPIAGTVTFARGQIDVSATFDELAASSAMIGIGGSWTDEAIVDIGAGLPAASAARLAPDGATDANIGLSFDLTGPFVPTAANTACAPAEPATISSGESYPGLADLLTTHFTPGGIARVCFRSFPTHVDLFAEAGDIVTPADPTFGSIAESLDFRSDFTAVLPPEIFDGVNLDLGALTTTQAVPAVAHLSVRSSSSEEIYYSATLQGTSLNVTLIPNL